MKIVTIGAAMQDCFLEHGSPQSITLDIDDHAINFVVLEEGKKIEIQNIELHVGGGALNSARVFKKLGFEVTPICKIGSDESAAFIKKELTKKKIATNALSKADKTPTGHSYIIPAESGNYALLVHRGANLKLEKKDIKESIIKSADQLYITSLSHKTAALLPHITALAKEHDKPVACNPGMSQLATNVLSLKESLQHIDILITNCLEATILMEHLVPQTHKPTMHKVKTDLPELLSNPISNGTIRFALYEYFDAVFAMGPQIVVVTNGADGVYIADSKNIYYHPSLPIEVTSTVGAGDAFGSTFVAQLVHGKTIPNALRAGIINCSAILETTDTTSGLLSRKELNELVGLIDQAGVKIFPRQKDNIRSEITGLR